MAGAQGDSTMATSVRTLSSRSVREVRFEMVFPLDLTPMDRAELHAKFDKLIDESVGITAPALTAQSAFAAGEEAVLKGTELVKKGRELVSMGIKVVQMYEDEVGLGPIAEGELSPEDSDDEESDEEDSDDNDDDEEPLAKKSKSAPNRTLT